MTSRTTTSFSTFLHPFVLGGYTDELPPGTYEIVAEDTIPAFAQSSGEPLPDNAHAKTYGDGWECYRGYRVTGKACAAVVVPHNAYPPTPISTDRETAESATGTFRNRRACAFSTIKPSMLWALKPGV